MTTATALPTRLAGALHDAQAGQTVGIVATIGTSRRLLRDAFDRLAEELQGDPSVRRIRHANGAERIDFISGGSIRFVTDPRGIRFHRVISVSALSPSDRDVATAVAYLGAHDCDADDGCVRLALQALHRPHVPATADFLTGEQRCTVCGVVVDPLEARS